jgi:hypothetical protein
MSENRYAPPAATVTDVESRVGSLERPRIVTIGVCLLWAEIALGIPGLVYLVFVTLKQDPHRTAYWVYVGRMVVQFAFLALSVFLTRMCWKGRNWARIAYLVLLILGLVVTASGYAMRYFMLKQLPDIGLSWHSVTYLLQVLLDIMAMCLLFTPGANAWYREMRFARRS